MNRTPRPERQLYPDPRSGGGDHVLAVYWLEVGGSTPAPQRGKNISRLLAYRESDWNLFVALARAKKSQTLPTPWKKVACNRVKDALREGGSL